MSPILKSPPSAKLFEMSILGKLSGKYSEDFEDVLADSESNSDMEINSMSDEVS